MADLNATMSFKTKVWVAERIRDMALADNRSISSLLSKVVENFVLAEAEGDPFGKVYTPSSKPTIVEEKVEEDGEV